MAEIMRKDVKPYTINQSINQSRSIDILKNLLIEIQWPVLNFKFVLKLFVKNNVKIYSFYTKLELTENPDTLIVLDSPMFETS